MNVTNKSTGLRQGSVIAWRKFSGDNRWYRETVTFCRRGSVHTIASNGVNNVFSRRQINRAGNVKVVKY